MPKVLEVEGFVFLFYSDEGNEPCHIHVKKGGGYAKIWLVPELKEVYYYGYTRQEIRKIRKLVEENKAYLKEKWDEYFRK